MTEAATETMPALMPARIVVAGPVSDCAGDLLHRAVVVGGVVLGGLAEGPADDESADRPQIGEAVRRLPSASFGDRRRTCQ